MPVLFMSSVFSLRWLPGPRSPLCVSMQGSVSCIPASSISCCWAMAWTAQLAVRLCRRAHFPVPAALNCLLAVHLDGFASGGVTPICVLRLLRAARRARVLRRAGHSQLGQIRERGSRSTKRLQAPTASPATMYCTSCSAHCAGLRSTVFAPFLF